MKKVLFVMIAVISIYNLGFSQIYTKAQTIRSFKVQNSNSNAYYYVSTNENNRIWATTLFSINLQTGEQTETNPIYNSGITCLFFNSINASNKEMLATLLTAKSTGSRIRASGTINGPYLYVQELYIEE